MAWGIIQVLHTWNQKLDYHVHMHCIVSGGRLTKDGKLRKSSGHFFIRTEVLRDKFKGKYMAYLSSLYESGSLAFSSSCEDLRNSYHWKEWKNKLYEMDWCPYIKETFKGFGNAMPLNILDAIPIRLPFPIAGSFLFPKMLSLFLPEGKSLENPNARSL